MGLWETVARAYDKIFTPLLQRDRAMIEQLLHCNSDDVILDFAGGTGRIAEHFQKHVQQIVVADSSASMLVQAQTKGLETTLVQNLPLPFDDVTFTKVLTIEALHHFQNQELYLREYYRILKPNGLCLIEEPNPQSWIRWFLWIERLFDRTTYRSVTDLSDVLRRQGFTITRTLTQGFRYYIVAKKV